MTYGPQDQQPRWQPEQYNPQAHYDRATFQRPQQPPPQWQQPGYPPPGHRLPPRKRGKGKIIAGILGGFFLLIVIIAAAASHGGSPQPSASSPAAGSSAATAAAVPAKAAPAKPAAASTVTYKVTGSPADVTYGPAGSSLAGHSGMTRTARLGSAAYYSISAQLQGGGSVTCEILVNGKVISRASASGGYNLADCEISQDPFTGKWQDANAA